MSKLYPSRFQWQCQHCLCPSSCFLLHRPLHQLGHTMLCLAAKPQSNMATKFASFWKWTSEPEKQSKHKDINVWSSKPVFRQNGIKPTTTKKSGNFVHLIVLSRQTARVRFSTRQHNHQQEVRLAAYSGLACQLILATLHTHTQPSLLLQVPKIVSETTSNRFVNWKWAGCLSISS